MVCFEYPKIWCHNKLQGRGPGDWGEQTQIIAAFSAHLIIPYEHIEISWEKDIQ